MPQNPPLTKSESPEPVVGIDKQEHLAGNWHDDDPIALDEYFEAADQSPETFDGLQIPKDKIAVSNRLVISSITFQIGESMARMLLPADPNRKHLYINGYRQDTGAVAGFLFAGEAFAVPGLDGTGPSMMPAKAVYFRFHQNLSFAFPSIDDYTGAVWVLPSEPTPNANPIMVQAMAVTV